jgi:hypothetical protein
MLQAMQRKFIVIGCIITLLLATGMLYQHIVQARRNAAYDAAIAPFERDLKRGMAKETVEEYLHAHNLKYNTVQVGGSPGERIEIQIGEESGSLFCDPWRVSAALELDQQAHLTDIHIVKTGTCL